MVRGAGGELQRVHPVPADEEHQCALPSSDRMADSKPITTIAITVVILVIMISATMILVVIIMIVIVIMILPKLMKLITTILHLCHQVYSLT